MREVVRGAVLAFALKVIGAGLTFGLNVSLARLLGVEDTGLYFLALSVTAIGSVIGRVGLDNVLLRFVATYATHQNWSGVQGVYAQGMRMALLVSAAVMLTVFVAAPWLASAIFNKAELTDPLRLMCLSILPSSLLNLQAESLKGLKRVRDAMLVQGIGVSLFALLLLYPLSQFAGVNGAVLAYAVSTILVALVGAWALHRTFCGYEVDRKHFSLRLLWASCKPLLLVAVMNRAILPWAPLFILGIWATSAEVGVYGAASRVAMLVTFLLVAVNNVVAPKFAELYIKGDMEALGQTARRTALMITLLASPIFMALIFGGSWIMGFFGVEFEQGGLMLMILAVGQLVNVMTGSVGYLLMMSGNEISFQKLTMVTTLLLLALTTIFVPLWGGVGAAMATSVAVAANNLGAVWLVWRKLGIKAIVLS
ncbi:polysaccharide biosynthesis related protein [Desulfolithobacter dissulfuricans]|uniref:Polysaccharide biosynthesis related protein n=2 Tax=Desulfolithobacter dissulfuricans TaxID=2795293 RepID=A0A915U1L4_9BACT|nr:polysaccharide biosynthesis related protein [Desulfolithobacter dissulfuricans]